MKKPNTYNLWQRYKSVEAVKEHMATEHVKEMFTLLPSILAAPFVQSDYKSAYWADGKRWVSKCTNQNAWMPDCSSAFLIGRDGLWLAIEKVSAAHGLRRRTGDMMPRSIKEWEIWLWRWYGDSINIPFYIISMDLSILPSSALLRLSSWWRAFNWRAVAYFELGRRLDQGRMYCVWVLNIQGFSSSQSVGKVETRVLEHMLSLKNLDDTTPALLDMTVKSEVKKTCCSATSRRFTYYFWCKHEGDWFWGR